jgi:hypothetical protein
MGHLFFWLTALTKLCDEVLWKSIDDPVFLILYQPLPAQQRFTVQIAMQGIMGPVAVALSGAILVLFGTMDSGHLVSCPWSHLDAEPRSASVTAEVDMHLFRLDQDALYELMADRFEVARGISAYYADAYEHESTRSKYTGGWNCSGRNTVLKRQCYLCISSALTHQLVVFPCG